MTWLERVGLSAFAHHYPHELSVGMRQRLGIGRRDGRARRPSF